MQNRAGLLPRDWQARRDSHKKQQVCNQKIISRDEVKPEPTLTSRKRQCNQLTRSKTFRHKYIIQTEIVETTKGKINICLNRNHKYPNQKIVPWYPEYE